MTAPAITFTLDLEDHRPSPEVAPRYASAARHILDRVADHGVTGTVFVVGEVAEAQPDLVREIAAAGHEVGLHAWRHVSLTTVAPDRFLDETKRGRDLLEDLTGTAVVGFRAPMFSLVPSTLWATDHLAELGFRYSSSVLPGANPLYGFPGAPHRPFRWPSGLLELPCPVTGVGRFKVPYLGGVYLRTLPWTVARWAAARERPGAVPFIYAHPYDADPAEPFWWVPEAGRLSPILWVGRSRTLGRLDELLAKGAGPSLAERAEGLDVATLPVFAG